MVRSVFFMLRIVLSNLTLSWQRLSIFIFPIHNQNNNEPKQQSRLNVCQRAAGVLTSTLQKNFCSFKHEISCV